MKKELAKKDDFLKGDDYTELALYAGILSVVVGALILNHLSRLIWGSKRDFQLIHLAESSMISAELLICIVFCIFAFYITMLEKSSKAAVAMFVGASRLGLLVILVVYNYKANPVNPKIHILLIERLLSYRYFFLVLLLSFAQSILLLVGAFYYRKGESLGSSE